MAGVEAWAEWAKAMMNTAAFGGAAGGLTNALVTKMTRVEAARHVAIGVLVAFGIGDLIGRIALYYLAPDAPEFRTSLTSVASGFLAGAVGAALIERAQAAIRKDDDRDSEEDPPRKP